MDLRIWLCSGTGTGTAPTPSTAHSSVPDHTHEEEMACSTSAVHLMVWGQTLLWPSFQLYFLRGCRSLNCIQAQNTGNSGHPSADGGNLSWGEGKQDNHHFKTLITNKHYPLWEQQSPTSSLYCEPHQTPALLKMLFAPHKFEPYQFEVFYHLGVNMTPRLPQIPQGEPGIFSPLLLPFTEAVLLSCPISLLSWMAVQIKIHLVSWLKASSKVSSIASSKTITA